MAGLLYETLFNKILFLGDEVIVCPALSADRQAHGAGSVCGIAIAERTWTTIGLERKHNPRLQYTDKADFVEHVARMLEYPPYFRMIEKLNLEGPPVLGSLPAPPPLSPKEFAGKGGPGPGHADGAGLWLRARARRALHLGRGSA